MDKKSSLSLSKRYLRKVKKSRISFEQAWLFGSYASSTQNENSYIDLAIVLKRADSKNFDTEVKLMSLRKSEETLIEPHIFTQQEFAAHLQLSSFIEKSGVRIKV